MRKAVCLLIALLLVPAAAAHAAPGKGEVADLIQQAYNGLNTAQADFVQQIEHKESGAVDTFSGVLQFKRPFLLRWEVSSPSPELIVVTTDAAWQYFEDEALAYKYQAGLAEDTGLLFRVLTGQSRLDQEFDIASVREADGLLRISAYPKEPVPQMIEAEIWVAPDNGFVQRVKSVDFYGNTTDVRLSNMLANPDLPDERFMFTPPEGTVVEDNTALQPEDALQEDRLDEDKNAIALGPPKKAQAVDCGISGKSRA